MKPIRFSPGYTLREHNGNKYVAAYRKPHLMHSIEAFKAADYISATDKAALAAALVMAKAVANAA